MVIRSVAAETDLAELNNNGICWEDYQETQTNEKIWNQALKLKEPGVHLVKIILSLCQFT